MNGYRLDAIARVHMLLALGMLVVCEVGSAHAELLDGQYRFRGTITNRTVNVSAPAMFTLWVSGGQLTFGYFHVGLPLVGSGPVSGTVSGGQCSLISNIGIEFSGRCGPQGFAGTVRIPSHNQRGDFATRIETVPTKYEARERHVCPSRKEPTRGAPSPEQARRYFLCDGEVEFSDELWLYEEVEVEIGNERPYNSDTDRYRDIDPEETVYPIRGSFTHYACDVVFYDQNEKAGRNCKVTPTPNATGVCYRDSFAGWHCRMNAPFPRPEPLRGLRPFPG